MKISAFLIVAVAVSVLAGCGNFEWFPSSGSSGGSIPNPPPPGGTKTDVQSDTTIKFDPYTVAFGNITSSTTSAAISISGDASSKYSINNGEATNAAGTVRSGDIVTVQNTSSNYGQNLSITSLLVIGGASAYYASTTGTLVFPTVKGQSAGSTVFSDTARVPATLPNGFTFPATISLASDSDKSSTMYINGSTFAAASPSPIAVGNTIRFKHTASASPTTLTHAIITGSNNVTYDVTFKSTLP